MISKFSIDTSFISIYIKKNSAFSFSYIDETYAATDRIVQPSSQDSIISWKINTTKSFLLFNNWGAVVPFLILPGDSIQFFVDRGEVKKAICVNHPERNDELEFFQRLTDQLGSLNWDLNKEINKKLFTKISRKPIYSRFLDSTFHSLYEKRLAFLKNYQKTKHISPSFELFVKKYLWHVYIKDRLLPIQNTKLSKAHLPRWYIQEMIGYQDTLSRDTSIYCNLYHSPVALYNKFLARKYLNKDKELDALYDTAKTIFKGKTRDYLLYLIMKQAAKGGYPDYSIYLKKFKNDENNTLLRNRIIENYNYLSLTQNLGTNAGLLNYVSDTNKHPILLKELLSRFRGKLVLIDFWASWCAPCIAEMPYSRLLKGQFRNRPIIFLYMSLDKDFFDWHKAISEKNMPSINSYLLINGFKAELSKQYKITSIPRYILIGKNGKIISADAPGPNDPKLKILINEYLEY